MCSLYIPLSLREHVIICHMISRRFTCELLDRLKCSAQGRGGTSHLSLELFEGVASVTKVSRLTQDAFVDATPGQLRKKVLTIQICDTWKCKHAETKSLNCKMSE